MAGMFQAKYSIDCLRISPDKDYVLCTQSKLNGATWGGRIDVLNVSESMKRTSASEMSSGVTSADWMDNSMFVAGTDDGIVQIYRFDPDALKLKLTTALNQHDRIVSSVAAKKEHVLSASHDGLIHLWSISSTLPSSVKATFRGHHDAVHDVRWFEKDENQFVSVGNEGLAFTWDTRSGSKSSCIRFDSDGILCVDVSQQNLVVVGMESGAIEVRDRRFLSSTKQVLYRDETSHRLPVFRVLMKDEHLVVSASDDTTVRVRSIEESKNKSEGGFTYDGHKDYVRGLEWGPSGCVLSGGRDRHLHCWMYLL